MALIKRVGRLATKTGKFWTDAYILYLAARDGRVPAYARLAAAAFAIYVISPIDIVPDPIPLIGIVDDYMIIPIGLLIVRQLVPEYLRLEHQQLAIARQPQRPGFGEAISIASGLVRRVPFPEKLSIQDVPRMLRLRGQ